MTETSMGMTESSMSSGGNFSFVRPFTPQSGAMIGNAWLIVVSLGNGEYAVVVHAEGLNQMGIT
jgi:hypothetical protein